MLNETCASGGGRACISHLTLHCAGCSSSHLHSLRVARSAHWFFQLWHYLLLNLMYLNGRLLSSATTMSSFVHRTNGHERRRGGVSESEGKTIRVHRDPHPRRKWHHRRLRPNAGEQQMQMQTQIVLANRQWNVSWSHFRANRSAIQICNRIEAERGKEDAERAVEGKIKRAATVDDFYSRIMLLLFYFICSQLPSHFSQSSLSQFRIYRFPLAEMQLSLVTYVT